MLLGWRSGYRRWTTKVRATYSLVYPSKVRKSTNRPVGKPPGHQRCGTMARPGKIIGHRFLADQMTVYVLTNEYDQTHGPTQWGQNVAHEVRGTGQLGSSGWIHCYSASLIAVLMDPGHVNFGPRAHLWYGDAGGAHRSAHGLREGYSYVKTIGRIDLPQVTTLHRVKFAVLSALGVPQTENWSNWGRRWLDGTDRSEDSASNAARGDQLVVANFTTSSAQNAALAAWKAALAVWVSGIVVVYGECAVRDAMSVVVAGYEESAAKHAAWAAEDASHVESLDFLTLAHRAVAREQRIG